MAQMKEVGWDRALIGGVNINIVLSGYDAAGLKNPLWLVQTEAMGDTLSPDSEASKFRQAYRDATGKNPAFYSLYLADGIYFIAEGSAHNPAANSTPRQRVAAVREFQAASGRNHVNDDGTLGFVMHASKVR